MKEAHAWPDRLKRLYVELTTLCNMDCGMCIRHVWDETPQDMPGATLDRLIEQLAGLPDLESVNFSGFGEPTSHPRFLETLKAVKSLGLRAELITNGLTLDDAMTDRLIEIGLDELIVSFDGPAEDETFHPTEQGSVQKKLWELNRKKKYRQLTSPEITVEFVASRRNIHKLADVARMSKEYGFSRLLVSNLIPYTEEQADDILYAHWTSGRREGKPSPWRPAVDLPVFDVRSDASKEVEYLHAIGTHLQVNGRDMAGHGMECRFSRDGSLCISATGGVHPCLALMHSHQYYFRGKKKRVTRHEVGDVNQSTLLDIWNDADFTDFRRRVRDFEFSPCIDCGGCELRDSNDTDCFESPFPTCGECLWAAGIVQCP